MCTHAVRWNSRSFVSDQALRSEASVKEATVDTWEGGVWGGVADVG